MFAFEDAFEDAVVAGEQHVMLLVAICCKGMTRGSQVAGALAGGRAANCSRIPSCCQVSG